MSKRLLPQRRDSSRKGNSCRGAGGQDRTADLSVMSATLLPTELPRQLSKFTIFQTLYQTENPILHIRTTAKT